MKAISIKRPVGTDTKAEPKTIGDAVLNIIKSHSIDLSLKEIIKNTVDIYKKHKAEGMDKGYISQIMSWKVIPFKFAY